MTRRFRAHLDALVLLLLAVAALVVPGNGQAARISPRSMSRSSSQDSASKIAPEVLAETADGTRASVVVFLTDQADVSAAHGMKDQDARGWHVYTTLKEHAERTQAGLRKLLEARSVGYRSYWAANMLVVTADRNLVEQLAARGDVARIDSNRPVRSIEDPAVASLRAAPESPDAVEWGVQNVNAPGVWALGYTGQGMVIGGQDTGIRWTHAALQNHYRGWNGASADHNYNWHDAIHSGGGSCGANSPAPCDDNGHGTHTIGTTSGDDGVANQVGVAPGAKWIGCRNMDQGNGTPATYTECFQFMIAPTDSTGQSPNPALRPHVVNNSWTCPASEGCTTRAELETIVNNAEAAGIFVEASAGNSGPLCSTVSDPPAIYSASFSTGAIDINNALAGFSSRGPSTYDTPNLLKPEISAPGVNVRSAYGTNDTSYSSLSGTSMAGPHVAGVVALLWSARPQLVRDIAATKTVLKNTANPGVTVNPAQTCGGTTSTTIPNNSFGYGRVDVLAAVSSVQAMPVALLVDPAADGGLSDGNGVLEPGESVFVSPSWKNLSGGAINPSGTASNFTGPAGPIYTLKDATADYGSIAGGATNNCSSATGNCYEVSVSNPPSRPSTHWDATLTETLSAGAPPKVWSIHIGQSFSDVLESHTFYSFIERLLHSGITSGCTPTTYCPEDFVFRLQMAIFIARAQAGGDANVPASGTAQGQPYNCASGGTSLFSDVLPTNPFCRHVHFIYSTNVTTGCEPGKYCPDPNVTRAQMALFISRAIAGGDAAVPLAYGPDPVTGRSYSCDPASPNLHFTDVTTSDIFCRATHFLWAKDVISGFPDDSYGPGLDVTRGAMAKFLANGFNLTLYGP